MTKDQRQRIAEALDALHGLLDGCRIAALVDGGSGLVLATSAATDATQDALDALAAEAMALRGAAPAGDGLLTVIEARDGETLGMAGRLPDAEEIVACRIDGTPGWADLAALAEDVLAAAETEEEQAA